MKTTNSVRRSALTPFALSVGAKRRSRRAAAAFRLRSLALATLNANGKTHERRNYQSVSQELNHA